MRAQSCLKKTEATFSSHILAVVRESCDSRYLCFQNIPLTQLIVTLGRIFQEAALLFFLIFIFGDPISAILKRDSLLQILFFSQSVVWVFLFTISIILSGKGGPEGSPALHVLAPAFCSGFPCI